MQVDQNIIAFTRKQALLKAVRYVGSQKALGEILGMEQYQVSRLINANQPLAEEQVLRIYLATNGTISIDELTPECLGLRIEIHQRFGNQDNLHAFTPPNPYESSHTAEQLSHQLLSMNFKNALTRHQNQRSKASVRQVLAAIKPIAEAVSMMLNVLSGNTPAALYGLSHEEKKTLIELIQNSLTENKKLIASHNLFGINITNWLHQALHLVC